MRSSTNKASDIEYIIQFCTPTRIIVCSKRAVSYTFLRVLEKTSTHIISRIGNDAHNLQVNMHSVPTLSAFLSGENSCDLSTCEKESLLSFCQRPPSQTVSYVCTYSTECQRESVTCSTSNLTGPIISGHFEPTYTSLCLHTLAIGKYGG